MAAILGVLNGPASGVQMALKNLTNFQPPMLRPFKYVLLLNLVQSLDYHFNTRHLNTRQRKFMNQMFSIYSGGLNTERVRISDGPQLFSLGPNHSKTKLWLA